MTDWNDQALLTAFVRVQSEPAFGELVRRYVNLVYSVALRQTGQPAAAEEVTQAVFIVLSRKAPTLAGKRPAFGSDTSLSGWLYQTARLTAANYLRTEMRRVRREQEAYMQSQMEEPAPDVWPQIAPLLDDALGRLGPRDRHALVLRFFENKSLGEIGAALGGSEAAARMRVNRALEKMRKFFHKRGVTLTAAMIAGAVSTHSVHAAPAHLAVTITAVTAQGAAAGSSTLTLAKGALKIMAWTKAKTAIAVTVGVLLVTGTATVGVRQWQLHRATEEYFQNMSWQTFLEIPSRYLFIRPTRYSEPGDPDPGTSITNPQRTMGRNQDVESLIYCAYQQNNSARTVRPALPFPPGRYDFLATVPGAFAKLQAEVKKRFGYVGHTEIRDTDVWQLRLKHPHAPGLQPGSGDVRIRMEDHDISMQNAPFADWVTRLEARLGQPVVDATGITGSCNIQLHWLKQASLEADREALRQAVRDQLGLELVPTNMPVELFVIEATK